MVNSLPSSEDFLGPIVPFEASAAAVPLFGATSLSETAANNTNEALEKENQARQPATAPLPILLERVVALRQASPADNSSTSSGNGSGSGGASSSLKSKHMAPQGWGFGPKPSAYTLLHDCSFSKQAKPKAEVCIADEDEDEEDRNGLRAKFKRFLEREARRKQQNLDRIVRMSEGEQDKAEAHNWQTEYATITAELQDINGLIADTRQALRVDKQLRNSARSSANRASAERYLQLQKIQFERSNVSVSPPPMHHRARGQPKKQAALAKRRVSPLKISRLGSSPVKAASRTPRHVPGDSRRASQACLEAQAAAEAAAFAARQAQASAAEAAAAQAAISRAQNAALLELVKAKQAKKMIAIVDRACDQVTKNLAGPIVGPIDRALGRLTKWFYGSDFRHQEQQVANYPSGQSGTARPGVLAICCSNAAVDDCFKEAGQNPVPPDVFIPEIHPELSQESKHKPPSDATTKTLIIV